MSLATLGHQSDCRIAVVWNQLLHQRMSSVHVNQLEMHECDYISNLREPHIEWFETGFNPRIT